MNHPTRKKALVTGGAGFLGSHLCERLLQEGYFVLCVDNFYTGKKQNLHSFIDHPRFSWMHHDVLVPLEVEVDEIYNFACPASPVHYQADPIQTLKTNVLGALHLLELARKCRCKILQASTSEVYGDPHLHPQKEEYWGYVNPMGTRSCYDEGKRCAETLFFDYYRTHQVEIKVARIFNTYGPRMDPKDGRVVSNFLVQALTHEPITIYGSGEQTRSFCYVDDLIDAIWQLMQTTDPFIGPVNLGNPEEFQVLDLAQRALKLTRSESPLIFCPLPLDDPRQRRPDIQRAQTMLSWQPKISLDEGLRKTAQYFEKALFPERTESLLALS